MTETLIVALSLVGLIISLYFTFAYYGRVKNSRWIPKFLCAREDSNCVTVVQTPYARVFGLPNSLLGIIYYVVIIYQTGFGLRLPRRWHGGYELIWPFQMLLPMSLLTVALGFYLIYVLRRKLHIDCPLCYTSHALNLAIFVLLLLATW